MFRVAKRKTCSGLKRTKKERKNIALLDICEEFCMTGDLLKEGEASGL